MNQQAAGRWKYIKYYLASGRVRYLVMTSVLVAGVFVQSFGVAVAAPQTVSLSPIADSHVSASSPTTNYGSRTALEVDGQPVKITYLKFDLTGLQTSDTVSSARLTLKVTDSSSNVQTVNAVTDVAWQENVVTYNNRPLTGSALASLNGGAAGQFVTVDISNYIKDRAGQIVSIALASAGSNGLDVASREASTIADRPVLQVQYASSTTQASAPTFSPAAGTYHNAVDVILASSTAGASIYYTTDGSTPNGGSTLYTGPINLTATTTINAIAVAQGLADSAVSTATYSVITASPTQGALLATAADIASCSTDGDEKTAAVLDTIFASETGYIAIPGDLAYPNGTQADFACYDASWGRFKQFTYPSPGNHEYNTPGASGYYNYFGARAGDPTKGYYSYDIDANWHAVAINSNCSQAGGCGENSPQVQWLRGVLAANADKNVFAYWHHPRYSSNTYNDRPEMDPIWDLLYANGVEFVLSGHEHHYERYMPLDNNDTVDNTYGIREFIVGTGGQSIRSSSQTPSPHSVTRNHSDKGVLKLRLLADSYTWEFMPVAGGSYADSGSSPVHAAPSQVMAQAPVFSPAEGSYTGSVAVEIASSTPGASIHFTTDGSTPTPASQRYTGPLVLTQTTTVRALAAASGYADSVVSSATYTIQQGGTTQTVFVNPVADSHVSASNPTQNYGAMAKLEIDGSPIKVSYMKFNLSTIPAGSTITSAKLRVYVADGSTSNQYFKLVENDTWTETGLTYGNRPAGSTSLASIRGGSAGQTIEVDLTSAVQSKHGGVLSFLIDSDGSNGLDVASREAASGRPVIEIVYR